MEKNKLRIYTLDEAKDKHLGEVGTERRDQYEYELRLDLFITKTSDPNHICDVSSD